MVLPSTTQVQLFYFACSSHGRGGNPFPSFLSPSWGSFCFCCKQLDQVPHFYLSGERSSGSYVPDIYPWIFSGHVIGLPSLKPVKDLYQNEVHHPWLFLIFLAWPSSSAPYVVVKTDSELPTFPSMPCLLLPPRPPSRRLLIATALGSYPGSSCISACHDCTGQCVSGRAASCLMAITTTSGMHSPWRSSGPAI